MALFSKKQPVKKDVTKPKKADAVLAVKPKVKSLKKENVDMSSLASPIISEKAVWLSEINQYVFRVANDANKVQIKNAVEGIYGVNVLRVNVLRLPGKKRRRGNVVGFKSGFKKALVKIAAGQKIELISK